MSAACVTCDGAVKVLGERRGYTYGACGDCGAVQLVPMPSPELLGELYERTYARAEHYGSDPVLHREAVWRRVEQVADVVARHCPIGDRRLIVDLGAGWGHLGLALRERGLPYVGVEPSGDYAAYHEEHSLRVVTGHLDALERAGELFPEGVQAVVSMAVFEHLPDQAGALRTMARAVPPGGVVIIQCPTAGPARAIGSVLRALRPRHELPGLFGMLEPPWHVCLPTPRSVRLLAERAGLRLEATLLGLSGRSTGAQGGLQAAAEMVGSLGFRLAGEAWPLVTGHVFLLRSPVRRPR